MADPRAPVAAISAGPAQSLLVIEFWLAVTPEYEPNADGQLDVPQADRRYRGCRNATSIAHADERVLDS